MLLVVECFRRKQCGITRNFGTPVKCFILMKLSIFLRKIFSYSSGFSNCLGLFSAKNFMHGKEKLC